MAHPLQHDKYDLPAGSVERLISSMRGRIIIGTVLHTAIKELEKVEGAMRQISTIEDMKRMLDSSIFINIHDDEE